MTLTLQDGISAPDKKLPPPLPPHFSGAEIVPAAAVLSKAQTGNNFIFKGSEFTF